MIFENWQLHKMTSPDAQSQVVLCRCQNAQRLCATIDWLDDSARHERMSTIIQRRLKEMSGQLGKFLGHPVIDEFMKQFVIDPDGMTLWRCKPLPLRGPTRSGKSRKGMSLFGEDCTLAVNCQGMAPNLPTIKEFDNENHQAILWDEISEQQVLHNKLVFQSGADSVMLGQSACNAFCYRKNLSMVPMILCSNTFSFTTSGGKPLSPEDAEWLAGNILDAQLPGNQAWYVPNMEFSDDGSTSSQSQSE